MSISWSTSVSLILFAKCNNWISQISIPDGIVFSSNYYDPIVKGVDKLDTTANTNKTKIILFLSDGRPSGGLEGVNKAIEAANYAKAHNVKIVTVGIGGPIDLNEELLKDMSKITGGKYYFASSSIALQGIYNNLAENTCSEICSV